MSDYEQPEIDHAMGCLCPTCQERLGREYSMPLPPLAWRDPGAMVVIPPFKTNSYVIVAEEVMADGMVMRSALNEMLDRMLRPWAYPDARCLPKFELFPRWAAGVAAYRRWRWGLREARRRLGAIVGGAPEASDNPDWD